MNDNYQWIVNKLRSGVVSVEVAEIAADLIESLTSQIEVLHSGMKNSYYEATDEG